MVYEGTQFMAADCPQLNLFHLQQAGRCLQLNKTTTQGDIKVWLDQSTNISESELTKNFL